MSCCSPRWRSFIYEAYSILSGLSREAAFQPMFHQFRSVAARFAEPTADNGTDQGHSPSPFQSGCRSRRWPARHRAYWQRANFFTVPLTGCGSHNVPLRLSSPAFRPGRFLIRGLDLPFPRTSAPGGASPSTVGPAGFRVLCPRKPGAQRVEKIFSPRCPYFQNL